MFERIREYRERKLDDKIRSLRGGHFITANQVDRSTIAASGGKELGTRMRADLEVREKETAHLPESKLKDMAVEMNEHTAGVIKGNLPPVEKVREKRVDKAHRQYEMALRKAGRHFRRKSERYYEYALRDANEAGVEIRKDTPEP